MTVGESCCKGIYTMLLTRFPKSNGITMHLTLQCKKKNIRFSNFPRCHCQENKKLTNLKLRLNPYMQQHETKLKKRKKVNQSLHNRIEGPIETKLRRNEIRSNHRSIEISSNNPHNANLFLTTSALGVLIKNNK